MLRVLRFRQIRAEELQTEAAAIVAERRGAVLEGLKLQASIPGVFTWLPAPPPAGQRVTLAYNKAHGALRCVTLFSTGWSMVEACVCERGGANKSARCRAMFSLLQFGIFLELLCCGQAAQHVEPHACDAMCVSSRQGVICRSCTPCRHSPDVRLHMGYDRWWQQDKEVVPLSQLSDSQVRQHGHPLADARHA